MRLTFDSLIPQGRSGNPENQRLFSKTYETALAFARRPEGWLVFTGPSGCGKTHLSAAIANQCIKEGRLALFIVVPDLLDHLRSTFSPNSEISYDELFEQVRNAPLLILDDLGTQSSTPWAEEKLFQILNHRFNARLPTVITTNVNLDDFSERLRTRLTDLSLSRVCVVEKSHLPVLEALDSLGFPLLAGMTFEKFDARGMNLVGEQRENLEKAFRTARNYAESPDGWLVLVGKHGVGKTHLAAAVAHYRKSKNDEVLFIEVPHLLDYLRKTFAPESKVTYDVAFEKVKTVPLLILDDFGEQASTPWAAEKLYQIVNYRYNTKAPTVITTSSSDSEMEERISSRMLDPRISLVFHIIASDYRSGVAARPDSRPEFPRGRRPR